MITTFAATPITVKDEAVLFAFDDHSIPLQDNLFLTFKQVQKHPANPVLRAGPPGSPDDRGCIIYGSVLPVGGKLRMWYLAWPRAETAPEESGRPMAYAESADGMHWERPNLGLVEWQGSRDNNLCLIEPSIWPVDDYLCVMHDPDDPDPARRYKLGYIFRAPASALRPVGNDPHRLAPVMATAVSPDGLHWQLVRPGEMTIAEKFEVSGIYKFGGMYHASGQQLNPWAWLPDGRKCGRVMTVYQSADFEHWSSARSLAFVRPGYVPRTPSEGEEVHMGAGFWNRGNVLVGLYGLWHGATNATTWPQDRLGGVRLDLGLVVSNDGLHFREPAPDFAVIPRGDYGEWDCIGMLQGHAFANMGERTCIWYSQWDTTGGGHLEEIGLGTLRRDGFAHFSRYHAFAEGHFVTCALQADGPFRLSLNADDVSSASPLLVELLDEQVRPIADYTAADCLPVTESGLRVPVRWRSREMIPGLAGRFKVRVILAAGGEEQQKVYAVYLREGEQDVRD